MRIIHKAAVVLFSGLMLVSSGCASGGRSNSGLSPGAAQIQTAMERVYPALVRIFVVMQEPSGGRMQRMQAAGSGVIISSDGYVVTNHHVAGNATRIVVNLSDREEVEATLVGSDPLADIAVIKLKLETRQFPDRPLSVATWGDSDQVRVGDAVLAMGSPGALSQSVTRGIVANTELILPRGVSGEFRLDGEDVGSIVRWIAHDAVIYGGNSGGPLVNLQGQIIGINEIGVASLGGAIPSNLARLVADELIKMGDVPRSWSGVALQPRLKEDKRTTGALVAGVVDDSPAQRAGLQAGDLLLSFNAQPVSVRVPEDMPPVNQLMLSTPIGATVPVVVERDGKQITEQLTTIRRQRPLAKPLELKNWGITARDITRWVMLSKHLDSQRGMEIDSVRPGGANADAKLPLQAGDIVLQVDGKDVEDAESLRRQTEALLKGRSDRVPVLVKFRRDARELMTVVKVGEDQPEDKPASVRKSWPAMATQVLTRDLAEAMNLKDTRGVRVTEVFARQSAEQAGFKVGDVITAVSGIDVEASQPEDAGVFDALIRKFPIGSDADFSVIRDGKKQVVKMKLAVAPHQLENAKRYDDSDFEFGVRDLVFEDRNRMKLPDGLQGVLIDRVERAGWAALGGLNGGDVLISVDGRTTGSVADVKSALDEARRTHPQRLVFFVRRGILTQFMEIEPEWQ